MKPVNLLLIYSYGPSEMRPTTAEHLDSFRAYSPHPVTYVNLAKESLPPLSELRQYDLIVFHYLYMANHWSGEDWLRGLMRKASAVLRTNAVKAILVQDEFYHPDLYCMFISAFGINCVFSVAPPAEWPKIYRHVDFSKVHFYPSLTGYVDDRVLLKPSVAAPPPKDIDIGYRTAGKPYFWFGRHGYLKQQIADAVLAQAPKHRLNIDISTSGEDTIHGDAWYEFLARCKYTIGVESGTSIVDHDGAIHRRTMEFARLHPDAGFEDAEAACFPGRDGEIKLFALGPRHLEACMTRTCQILTEGDYNGVLRPWEHYIPVRKDFSNINEVLELVKEDTLRQEITERAYQDIVASGRYSYRTFVNDVVNQAMRHQGEHRRSYWSYAIDDSLRRVAHQAHAIPGRAKRFVKKIAGKVLARHTGNGEVP